MSDLRALVREVLTEELSRLRGGAVADDAGVTEETVSIRSNAELDAFVKRLLRIAQDGRMRAEIETGRRVFRLGDDAPVRLQAHQPLIQVAAPASARFERGLVTEKDIAKLPEGARLSLGKSVRLTPLAKDEIGRRAIRIERGAS